MLAKELLEAYIHNYVLRTFRMGGLGCVTNIPNGVLPIKAYTIHFNVHVEYSITVGDYYCSWLPFCSRFPAKINNASSSLIMLVGIVSCDQTGCDTVFSYTRTCVNKEMLKYVIGDDVVSYGDT